MLLTVSFWCQRLLIEDGPCLDFEEEAKKSLGYSRDWIIPYQMYFEGVTPDCLKRERFVNVIKWRVTRQLQERTRLSRYKTNAYRWGRPSFEFDFKTDEWKDLGWVPFDADQLDLNPTVSVEPRQRGGGGGDDMMAQLMVRVTLRLMKQAPTVSSSSSSSCAASGMEE